MDDSGFGSEFMSSPDDVLLDIESPIHDNQQSQLGNSSMVHEKYMNVSVGLGCDHQPIGLMLKGYSTKYSKGKAVGPVDKADGSSSDDDEPSFMEDGIGENSNAAKNKMGMPWQRMKWTDNVVRLLIAVVACIGEDGTLDGGEGHKRKSGVLQKKGKWKLVSEIMINKGCHVSPQQCEDKFNDLNKRYKKLNEILGKGVSCKVVENPALMNSMPQLSAQEKDDVKKILNSKHLFYREMCAYHNGQKIPNCQDLDLQGLPLEQCSKDDNGLEEVAEENDESDDDDDDSDDEDDDNAHENGERTVTYPERERADEENARHMSRLDFCNNFYVEMAAVFQDPAVSSHERKEWIKRQKLLLMEQRVGIQAQAFEIEKQQLKWSGYRSRKNREFERLRLENVKMKIENEQSILHLRQKRMEMDLRSSEMSAEPASVGSDGIQGREHDSKVHQ